MKTSMILFGLLSTFGFSANCNWQFEDGLTNCKTNVLAYLSKDEFICNNDGLIMNSKGDTLSKEVIKSVVFHVDTKDSQIIIAKLSDGSNMQMTFNKHREYSFEKLKTGEFLKTTCGEHKLYMEERGQYYHVTIDDQSIERVSKYTDHDMLSCDNDYLFINSESGANIYDLKKANLMKQFGHNYMTTFIILDDLFLLNDSIEFSSKYLKFNIKSQIVTDSTQLLGKNQYGYTVLPRLDLNGNFSRRVLCETKTAPGTVTRRAETTGSVP